MKGDRENESSSPFRTTRDVGVRGIPTSERREADCCRFTYAVVSVVVFVDEAAFDDVFFAGRVKMTAADIKERFQLRRCIGELPVTVAEDAIVGKGADDIRDEEVVRILNVRFGKDFADEMPEAALDERHVEAVGIKQLDAVVGEFIRIVVAALTEVEGLLTHRHGRDVNRECTALFNQRARKRKFADCQGDACGTVVERPGPGGGHYIFAAVRLGGDEVRHAEIQQAIGFFECDGLQCHEKLLFVCHDAEAKMLPFLL